MKLQHLKFFCAVVESRSMTAASERLHISQPALSAGLKALQDDLGLPLFDRSGGKRRIFPTPTALRFYEDAKDILSRCEAARIRVTKTEPKPTVARIGILRTLASADVATVLGKVMRFPSPTWKAREGTSAEIGQWLAQGRIDMAWTTIDRPSATAEILWHESFDLLTACHHRLAQSGAVSITDLAGEDIILRTSCELRSGRLQAAGIKLRVVARTDRDDLALKLVAQGIGVAIAPQSFAGRDIVALPFSDIDLSRTIGLRWRPDLPDAHVASVKEAVSACGHGPA
ncbi:MAG: LysR family transcriptional regulator [Gemmobacter sp.]|jgi:DNA-binding transcriptional LysR family regulator|nr:LysR family transcriptional regulator [Gemmobacter sp.]